MTAAFPRFEPAGDRDEPTPLFLDTNVLVAHLYTRASRHDEVRSVMQAIGSNDLLYYPLVTNQYVVDEIVSLLLSRADTAVAQSAVDRILESDAIRLLDVEPSLVDRALDQFQEYDDQAISVTDHTIGVQAEELGIDHVFSYDAGFRTLGFTTLPRE